MTDRDPFARAWDCVDVLSRAHDDMQDPLRQVVRALIDALGEAHAYAVDTTKRAYTGEMTPCASCGQGMPVPAGSGRRREYCSDACRQAAYRARRTPLKAELNPDGWTSSGSPRPEECRHEFTGEHPCGKVGIWRAQQRIGDRGTWATFWCGEHLPDEYRAVTAES